MNTDEITKRIYDKSDFELRQKIQSSVGWIGAEGCKYGQKLPDDQLDEINAAWSGGGFEPLKASPWLGWVMKVFSQTAFSYLRDQYRADAISQFMAKVESITEIAAEFGEDQ